MILVLVWSMMIFSASILPASPLHWLWPETENVFTLLPPWSFAEINYVIAVTLASSLVVARNCVYGQNLICSSCLTLVMRAKTAIPAPNAFSLFRFLKEKVVTSLFHLETKNFGLCFAAKEKFYWHFLATTFFHMATEKKNFSWKLEPA